MRVLSLFDGLSCGQIALNRIGIKPEVYYAAEVDKYAIKVTQANYPNTIQLGDVTKWREWDIDWASIDLLIGGSPCQGFSFAGKQLAFDDPRSKLFFVYVDILNHIKSVNPNVKFMLENVKMKKEFLAVISEHLGVEPVFINSALVSAQNRQRYYWCNWNVEQPEDRGIVLADILETDGTGFIKSHGEYKERREKSQCIDANYHKGADNHGQRTLIANPAAVRGRYIVDGKRQDGKGFKVAGLTQQTLEVRNGDKSNSLTTVQKDTVVSSLPPGRYPIGARFNRKDGLGSEVDKEFSLNASDWRGLNRNQTQTAVVTGAEYRKLTPIECERLQGVEDNYTNHVSNTQRYKMLGNGWQIDTVAHIFSQMQVPISLLSRQLDLFGEAA
jgi:DNA-cytosine methyltransferase